LYTSRVAVAWISTGACIAAYDRVIEYANKRIQFGKSISSFQLVQQKLALMMGDIQAMLYFCKRAADLYIKGQLSMGQTSLVKAWTTAKGRDILRLAREIMGGNGVLTTNWVMRALVDMESLYTYEGTYDINMLLCAKELTGISSFK
jgi:acyl-CoA oxidase